MAFSHEVRADNISFTISRLQYLVYGLRVNKIKIIVFFLHPTLCMAE